MSTIANVLQSKSVKELLPNLSASLKKVFSATKVNYLFLDKESVDLLRKEGLKTKAMTHAHTLFHVVVPEGTRPQDFEMSFHFKNIADVTRGGLFAGRYCVAPVGKLQKPDQPILLVQMEARGANAPGFDQLGGKKAFEIFSKILQSIFERIEVNARTAQTHERAYLVLKTFGGFMGKKKHQALCESFEERFPPLFNFESCGLLFVDPQDGCLYKIQSSGGAAAADEGDQDDPERTGNEEGLARKPVIVRLPKDRGVTGLAITTREVQSVPDGEFHIHYAPEVDNSVGARAVTSCLIGPCFDSTGRLRGVIQLINKQGSEAITYQDEREFENLLSTVAEMIKQADECKYVSDVSANMSMRLALSKKAIEE